MFGSSRFAPSPVLRSLGVLAAGVSVVAFSGSRCGFVGRGELAFCSFVPLLPAGCPVLVGDARGVDAAVRSVFPAAQVFRVCGAGRGAFAARSVRLVSSLRWDGLLVAFPGAACPVGLVPSALPRECFCGLGSGSWASVAFAVGSGFPVLVWVPSSLWVPASWRFEPVGSGWFSVAGF